MVLLRMCMKGWGKCRFKDTAALGNLVGKLIVRLAYKVN